MNMIVRKISGDFDEIYSSASTKTSISVDDDNIILDADGYIKASISGKKLNI